MSIVESVLSCIIISGGIVYFTTCIIAFAGHFKRPRVITDYFPSVSVIIAARNEEDNIGQLLENLLGQDYPRDKLTIVVVDDCSEDSTVSIVKQFASNNDRICLRDTKFSKSLYTHKKKAVHEGILSGDSEIIMTVDADCKVQRNWVRSMVAHFAPGIDCVAGEVTVEGTGLLGGFEILEFTGIQIMAAGLMNASFPITCNGANLAYRRRAFEKVDGFNNIGTMVSGDDDLLMQKIAAGHASSVIFAKDPETAVRVKAQQTWRAFIAQRTRWASKITAYPSRWAVILLATFFAFFITVTISLAGGLFGVLGFEALIIGYGLKVAGDLILCYYGVVRDDRTKLLLLFPLAELLHVPYIIGVTVRGVFGSFEWRGRRTGSKSVAYGDTILD